MVGRKCVVPSTTIIDTIMKFKDRVICKNDAGEKSKYQLPPTYVHLYKLFQILVYY